MQAQRELPLARRSERLKEQKLGSEEELLRELSEKSGWEFGELVDGLGKEACLLFLAWSLKRGYFLDGVLACARASL